MIRCTETGCGVARRRREAEEEGWRWDWRTGWRCPTHAERREQETP